MEKGEGEGGGGGLITSGGLVHFCLSLTNYGGLRAGIGFVGISEWVSVSE